MKFSEFTNDQIVNALIACSNPKGNRCSSCPINGKGWLPRTCSDLVMKRAAKIIREKLDEKETR